jgi:DNA-binding GntR family transcriptional regulator
MSLEEHRSIATAILGGDAAMAEAKSRKHPGSASHFVYEAPDQLFRTSSDQGA